MSVSVRRSRAWRRAWTFEALFRRARMISNASSLIVWRNDNPVGACAASSHRHLPSHVQRQTYGRLMNIDQTSFMDPATQEDPFAYYDALLNQAPVYFMKEIGAYVVSKYEDIRYVVAHPEIWSIDMSALPQAQLIKTPCCAQASRRRRLSAGHTPDDRSPCPHAISHGRAQGLHPAARQDRKPPSFRSAVDDLTREMARTGSVRIHAPIRLAAADVCDYAPARRAL